ncbi:hypothetical protein ACP275_12G142900 [Erythranthe tilingii]
MSAARKGYGRYLSGGGGGKINPATSDDQFELDESEIWGANCSNDGVVVGPERKKQVDLPPVRKSGNGDHRRVAEGANSLPVNVPDWSKILGSEYKGRGPRELEDEEGDEGNDGIPPHEYLAKNRGASLSVHEGRGRTLKGRDLSRVRDAVWKKFGFQD